MVNFPYRFLVGNGVGKICYIHNPNQSGSRNEDELAVMEKNSEVLTMIQL